jgi:hypothetical protein
VIRTQGELPPEKEGSGGGYFSKVERKPKEHVALLSLTTFLRFFSSPASLADHFERRGESLVGAWNSTNSSPRSKGCRRPLNVTYVLDKHEWKNSKNRKERSSMTLQLNTFGFTHSVQQRGRVVMQLSDVKARDNAYDSSERRMISHAFLLILLAQVLIKLRHTTAGNRSEDDEDDLRYDPYGFACILTHFLGILRCLAFAEYGSEVRKLVAADVFEAGKVSKESKRRKIGEEQPAETEAAEEEWNEEDFDEGPSEEEIASAIKNGVPR